MIFNMIIYSANREYIDSRANRLNHYCEWSYNYLYNDVFKYWDENNLWDEFPVKLAEEYSNKLLPPSKQIVGCIGYTFYGTELHIKRIFTVKHQRGKGYAKRLLEHAWKDGYNKGCKVIRMWCDKEAIPFYSKLGFKYLGINKNEYAYVYTPLLTKNMSETLNKTKYLNPFKLLKETDIYIPDEAKIFCL